MKKSFIIYTLPKSRTTQKFKTTKTDKIINALIHFLKTCTTSNFNNPDKILLTAHTAYDDTDPTETLLKIIADTKNKFGPSEESPISYHYPSGEPSHAKQHEWKLETDRFIEVIDYLNSKSPLPKSSLSALELYFYYHFKLKDPVSGEELPDQETDSSISIWLSRGKACSPHLFFPFDNSDNSFWEYLDILKAHLPFELEEKYLRFAPITKKGDIGTWKKLTRPM